MTDDRCTLCGARDDDPTACLAIQRGERDRSMLPCPASPEAEVYEGTDIMDDLALAPAGELWPRVAAERARRNGLRMGVKPDLGPLGRTREDAWIQTASGLVFKPWAPTPDMVRIEDVAHALSHLCRFNGHTAFLYTVGQHSILGADEMVALDVQQCVALWGLDRRRLAMLFLLHDAAEAYVGDVVSPIKRHAANFFGPLEMAVQLTIFEAAGVRPPSEEEQKVITYVDLRMLATEKRDLHHAEPQSWELSAEPFEATIHYQNPATVRSIFLERYAALR